MRRKNKPDIEEPCNFKTYMIHIKIESNLLDKISVRYRGGKGTYIGQLGFSVHGLEVKEMLYKTVVFRDRD